MRWQEINGRETTIGKYETTGIQMITAIMTIRFYRLQRRHNSCGREMNAEQKETPSVVEPGENSGDRLVAGN